jgi:predicted kinase
MLVVFAGLPGTGKSSLVRELARHLPAVVLDKDLIRAALFPPDEIEYSIRQDDFCVTVMLQVAGYLFEKDARKTVILDGRPYTRAYQVQQVVDFCSEREVPWRLIECVCSPETALARLRQAAGQGAHVAANRDKALYDELRAHAEPISIPRLVVDTDQPFETCLERCRIYLADKGPE